VHGKRGGVGFVCPAAAGGSLVMPAVRAVDDFFVSKARS